MKKIFLLTFGVLFFLSSMSYSQMPPFTCSTGNTYTPISGTPGPSGDDGIITAALPFTFTYLGTGYTQVTICTNGWISMGTTTSYEYTNELCTTDPLDLNKICGFWDDLNTNEGGDIQYATIGTSPGQSLCGSVD